MLDQLRERTYRLAPDGVDCGAGGLSVGGVALLARLPAGRGPSAWEVRPLTDINRELTARYGLPVDVEGKASGFAFVAGALDNGEIALAQIGGLLLRFPDPPRLAKDMAPSADAVSLARELFFSGLLKADAEWVAQHPRTGTPPNPGWFALVPHEPKPPKTPGAGWPSRAVNVAIREVALELALDLIELDPRVRAFLLAVELAAEVFDWLRREFSYEDFETSQRRIKDQICASLQSPKTLEQLQQQPEDCLLGYERHHIVEENPDNVLKDDSQAVEQMLKFGIEVLNDPSNIVWVPRLQHEQITAEYNAAYFGDKAYPSMREAVSTMDYDSQREIGLAMLREFGILQ